MRHTQQDQRHSWGRCHACQLWLACTLLALVPLLAAPAAFAAAPAGVDPAVAGGDPITGAEATDRVAFVVEVGASADALGELVDVFLAHDMTASLFVATPPDEAMRDQLQRAAAQGFAIGVAAPPRASEREVAAAAEAFAAAAEAPIGVLLSRGPARAGLTLVRPTLDATADAKRVVGRLVAARGGIVRIAADSAHAPRVLAALLTALEAHNCAAHTPLLPASLHVFVRDHGRARPPPAAVTAALVAYRDFIPAICRGPTPVPPPAQTRGIRFECLENPLAPGCGP